MRWKTPKKEVNVIDQDLLAASRQGNVTMLQEALHKGAKPDCTEDSGWMPLHLACAHRHEEVVEILLEANANPDLLAKINGLSPLSVLIRTYCEENADRLGHQRRQYSTREEATPSALSQVQENEEQKLFRIAEALLRFGADPSGCEDIQNPSSPIHIASRYGLLDIVKLLVEYGALMIHEQARQAVWSSPSLSGKEKQQSTPSPVPETTTTLPSSTATTTRPTCKGTLTPLSAACQAGEVPVMDYLLSILPPQTLETSFVLQQAVLEARRNRQVDCLVGLWEYSEEVLWLDCERFTNGIDPARKYGLEQTFFHIFDESYEETDTVDAVQSLARGKEDQQPTSSIDDTANTWLEILQEACRRRSVNLLQPLLLRLPNQDQFFEQIRQQHDPITAALIQAVDPRDHQTLLHRFCAGDDSSIHTEDTATATAAHGSTTVANGKTSSPVLSPIAAAWIRRLLQLSRESDEVDLEQIRKAQLESNDQENFPSSKYTAMYQSDWNLNLESGLLEEDSDDNEEKQNEDSSSDDDSFSDSDDETSDSDEENSSDEDGEIVSDDSVETTQRENVDRTPVVHDELQQEGGNSDSDESYSLDSATATESDDGFRSVSSSSGRSAEELHESFVELPSHSGKDLVNAADCNQQTPLHIACSRGVVPAISILLEDDNININATDSMGNTPFHVSIRSDVILVLLQDSRTDVNAANSEGKTRLHTAIEQDDMPIFQLLLANGADLEITDEHGRTPLYFACAEGSLEICSFLLAHGADPNTTTKDQLDTPLHAASRGGHMGPIIRLFNAKVDVADVDGRTPLHVACSVGHLEVVEYLVTEMSASLNVQDKAGHTPFEVACHGGCVDIVYYFVRYHSMNVWSRETRALALSLVGPDMIRTASTKRLPSYDSSFSSQLQSRSEVDDENCVVSASYYPEDPFEYSKVFDPAHYKDEDKLSGYITAMQESPLHLVPEYDTMFHPVTLLERSCGNDTTTVLSDCSFSVSYDAMVEPFVYDLADDKTDHVIAPLLPVSSAYQSSLDEDESINYN
jgi:ankyrin repeat protein